jgi:hypothetical protein
MSEIAVYGAPALLKAHESLTKAHQKEHRSEVERPEIAVHSAPGLAKEGLRSGVDMSEIAVYGAPALLKAHGSLTKAHQNGLAAHEVESLGMKGKHHLDLSKRASDPD